MSTVLRIAVVFEGLLRIGRLILLTRFGRQGLLRRNLITVFFTVNNPREKFSHPPRPGSPSRACRCSSASAGKHCIAHRRCHKLRTNSEEKTLENKHSAPCRGLKWNATRRCGRARRCTRQRQHNGPATRPKTFHIRACRRGGGNADLRKTAHAFWPCSTPADAMAMACGEPVGISSTRPPKRKRPPEGGRFRTGETTTQCSSSSRPSAYASGSSSSLSSSLLDTSTTNIQPSP